MFEKDISFAAKELVARSIPHVTLVGLGNSARLFHDGQEFIVRASGPTNGFKVLANNIHYLRWLPLIHVYQGEFRVFSPKEILDRGKLQHGMETMNLSIDLDYDKANNNPYYTLVDAFYEAERYVAYRDAIVAKVDTFEEEIQRMVAVYRHPASTL